MKKLIILIIFNCNILLAFDFYNISLSGLSRFPQYWQTDQIGNRNNIEFIPMVGLGLTYILHKDWSLEVSQLFGYPQESTMETNKSQDFFTQAKLRYHYDRFHIFVGPTLGIMRVYPTTNTQTITLDNGSSTSDFYLQTEQTISYNNILSVGLGINFNDPNLTLEYTTQIYYLLNSTKRNFSHLLTLSLRFTP